MLASCEDVEKSESLCNVGGNAFNKCARTDTMGNSMLVPHKVKLRITV